MIEIGRLRERLFYDPTTGNLYWLTARVSHRINKKAGVTLKSGHIKMHVDGQQIYAHRVAWALHYGVWPEKEIDHINGVPGDNRIENLREVDHIQNLQNVRGGPYWNKRQKKWHVQVRIFGSRRHVGYFDTEEAAHTAYRSAVKLRGEYARAVA